MPLQTATFLFRHNTVFQKSIGSALVASLLAYCPQVLSKEPQGQPLGETLNPDSVESKEPQVGDKLEVLLIEGRRVESRTELNSETERLFSVAGAAVDPLQAIYALPGITFSTGFNTSDPVIRGSAPQDNAYYIDMVPAKYIFHGFGNSIFDKNIINNFAVLPAAYGSEYSDATGGVIDVTLRDPRNQDFQTTVNWSFIISGVLVESGIGDDQAFYASYRRSMIDRFVNEEDAGDEDQGVKIDALPVSDDYQVKYNWDINPHHKLSLVAAGASDTLAATFNENSNMGAQDPDFVGPASIDQGFDSQGLSWRWTTNQRELTTLVSHIRDYQKWRYGADQKEITTADRTLAKIRYGQSLADSHWLRVGASTERYHYDLDIDAKLPNCADNDPDCLTVDEPFKRIDRDVGLVSHRAFIEDTLTLGDKQSLTLGAHYSVDNGVNDSRIEPRASWRYGFKPNWTTGIALGQYSQLPELRQSLDEIGNPDLKKVKADHYVWSLEQNLNDGWSWKTELYYKNLYDVVISVDETSVNYQPLNYSNEGEGSAYGSELLVNKNLSENWYGWVSLSLAETRRKNIRTGEEVLFEYDKPVMVNLVFNRLIGARWQVGAKWSFQSGGRYTPITELSNSTTQPDVMVPIYGDLNSQRLPDYHRLDIRAEYKREKSWGYWTFFADILNAYNQENIQGYQFAPNGQELVQSPPGYGENVPVSASASLGVFPSMGFEIQF